LKLAYRFGDHWASVEVGRGLTIGLHPASGETPAGRKGSMAIGLELAGKFVGFEDPDGNQLSLTELNWSQVDQGEGKYEHA
jgi:hypothetical protein